MTGNRDLIEQYREIHSTRDYGSTSVKNLRFIRPEIRLLRPASVLDYGCGQSRLLEALDLGYPVRLERFDPAIPGYDKKPEGVFDLLINIDVLEHIEEADLDAVIGEMRSMCREALIIIDTKPAVLHLADGRNAHVTVRPHAWWQARLARHFPNLEPIRAARRSRAGFRTWSRKPGDSARWALMRIEETTHYFARRLAGKRR
jgi:hypothetical protein